MILGNPPYNAFAGVSPTEEMGLVEPYKNGLVTKWKIKKFNLDELYARFYRIAERRITEGKPGTGVVAFVSSFSYLDDASFVVMRQRLISEFDGIWIDCMNGDSRETGKLTPEGKPDPSVFSTEYNREGIRLGTAVGVLTRPELRSKQARVWFREFWGTSKRKDLVDSLNTKDFDEQYERANPEESNRYSFRPLKISKQYLEWPKVIDLCAMPPSNGLMEKRGGALIDIDRAKLEKRMLAYFDSKLDWAGYSTLGYGLTQVQGRFDPKSARLKALASEKFDEDRIVRYSLRPFDTRWAYYTGVRPVWNEPRPQLWAQFWKRNTFLVTRFKAAKVPEGPPLAFTAALLDDHFLSPDAVAIPFRIRGQVTAPNLAPRTKAFLESVGLNSSNSGQAIDLAWMHALSVGYSPSYLAENFDGVRGDWPRIPLPDSKDALIYSAELGRQIAALLDTENSVAGVTAGAIRPELKEIAIISREGGGSLEPAKGDLALTAGWGHAGKDGAVMPGKGLAKVRDYTKSELSAFEIGAKKLGISSDEFVKLLGEQTMDIHLNDVAYWKNVPTRVWEYTIGGYQVIKKWLSYRERDLLDRDLSTDEVDEVTAMARRIAAIILLEPSLDVNYEAVKAATYNWPSTD